MESSGWSVTFYRRHGKALFDDKHYVDHLCQIADLPKPQHRLPVERIEIVPTSIRGDA